MRRVFIDTETTGVGHNDYIIEVGYVFDDRREEEFHVEYDPHDVNPGAHGVNNLGPGGRAPNGVFLTDQQAANRLCDDWRDAELVFNNPAFDIRMIYDLLAEHGFEPTWRYHPVDVKMLLIGRAGCPTNASRDQWLPGDVAPEPDVHSALEGAKLVKRQFEAYEKLCGR